MKKFVNYVKVYEKFEDIILCPCCKNEYKLNLKK